MFCAREGIEFISSLSESVKLMVEIDLFTMDFPHEECSFGDLRKYMHNEDYLL